MLDVDEHRLVVRREGNAGHFRTVGADEETTQAGLILRVDRDLLALCIEQVSRDHREHLVIGVAGDGRLAVVGLYPQDAAAVEGHAVGAGELVQFGQAGAVDVRRTGGVGAKDEDVPGERDLIVGVMPANDVAVTVRHARVGGVGGGAAGVVGQRQVDITVERVDRGPFRAVHWCRAHSVGSATGVENDARQVGELGTQGAAIRGRRSDVEQQPVAAAIGIEARDIQLAAVHVLGAGGQTITRVGVCRFPQCGRHELVEVLVLRVVAHVEHHRFADGGQARPAAFVTEAAQCGAFDRQGAGVVRIDLDDVAIGAGFVAVVVSRGSAGRRDVETREFIVHFRRIARRRLPAIVARRGADTDTHLICRAYAPVDEDAWPVLFAGQVSAPRRVTVATVVVGAPGLGAADREFGLDAISAPERTRQVHDRRGRETAVQWIIVHHLPALT